MGHVGKQSTFKVGFCGQKVQQIKDSRLFSLQVHTSDVGYCVGWC